MVTVLLTGVGAFGTAALELLARSDGVDRIITLKRSPWAGASATTLTMLGSMFQGYFKDFTHIEVDLMNVDDVTRVLSEVQPDAILHSATVQSPRVLMRAQLHDQTRALLRQATFGMWLPWHLLPAQRLLQAIERADVRPVVVNAAFPDVVNPVLWRLFGWGPRSGAGNLEICAVRLQRYIMEAVDAPAHEVHVGLVGSHALLSYGPAVPHAVQVLVRGEDHTANFDLSHILLEWPEPIDWRRVDAFSIFAASAVKNLLALLRDEPVYTHMTSPDGLPGGYPVCVDRDRIQVQPPAGIDLPTAIAINERAARWDGIESITADGTVLYTSDAAAAMSELGYPYNAVYPDTLSEQAHQLLAISRRLLSEGKG